MTRFLGKTLLVTTCIVLALACKPEPEFYINGKPYYTRTYCEKGHSDVKFTYHYGYWLGKFQWHFGPQTVYTCDLYKTDTLLIADERR